MKRKTLKVEQMVNQVNEMLRSSTATPDVRLGMCTVLERMLHDTNNYGGFRYLTANEVPDGQRAGINMASGDFDEDTLYEMRFRNTDDSRRVYFYS